MIHGSYMAGCDVLGAGMPKKRPKPVSATKQIDKLNAMTAAVNQAVEARKAPPPPAAAPAAPAAPEPAKDRLKLGLASAGLLAAGIGGLLWVRKMGD